MAFRITRDFITSKGEPGYGVGKEGPRTARDETLERLRNDEGEPFRLLDDDGNVYYHGLFIDDSDAEGYDGVTEFQPLDCYGLPNAGAVTIEYRNPSGEWEGL